MSILLNRKLSFCILLSCIFLFRVLYGLSSEFWSVDEIQVYLLGLKYYSTNLWPYYGSDVVYTNSQISGALQALLVGLPLKLFSEPESPIIFLNIISFLALYYFGWYIKKRVPSIPFWFILCWLMLCPWTLWFGTRVINPSYVLPFSILFFIGFFETGGFFKQSLIKPTKAFFYMGVALTAIMQIHLSWVLLLPFMMYSFFQVLKTNNKKLLYTGFSCFMGCILGAIPLLPTLFSNGFKLTSGHESAIIFNIDNLKNIGIILTRYLSFASFEVPYMIGGNTNARLQLVQDNIWMAPSTIIVLIIGLAQVALFIRYFFKKDIEIEGWSKVKNTVLISWLFIYVAFFFSIKGPSSHTFYICLPVVFLYSFYCYSSLFAKPFWKRAFLPLFLLNGVIFHLGLINNNFHHHSLYKNRDKVVKAIKEKDYKSLGIRRAEVWGYGY